MQNIFYLSLIKIGIQCQINLEEKRKNEQDMSSYISLN